MRGLVMCTGCGNFVDAVLTMTDDEDEKTLQPLIDMCPKCGGTQFKPSS